MPNYLGMGGLTIRDTIGSNAAHVSLVAMRSPGVTMISRKSAGEQTKKRSLGLWEDNVWLKLVKTGNSVACYFRHASMGKYMLLGREDVEFTSDMVLVGLAVASSDTSNHAVLHASNLTIVANV